MLKFIARILGLWLIAVALVAIVLDGTRTIAAAQWAVKPLGQYWYEWSPSTLNLSQAAVQRYVDPGLWDPVILWILQQPVWISFGALGFFLVWLGDRRRRRDNLA